MGEMQETIEILTQENAKVAEAAKEMIKNISHDFSNKLESMTEDLQTVRKFVEDELHTLHKEVDAIRKEWRTFK